jgi:two-component system response regulator HydG
MREEVGRSGSTRARAADGSSGRREAWNPTLDDFHSADPPMQTCLELARVAARTDLPVLILGESGTGKTLLARAIHNSSARSGGPFISFNAAALSDTLLDSQLFGHEKGAFTGADKRVKGKFELADLGTLFIDEIADMTPAAQAKILRAIEYGEFERLGSESLQVADVRLISATHLPLRRFIESEQFRKDLFYRISGITIIIPPLRQRPQDLRSLVAAEIELASREQDKAIIGLGKRTADLLFSYHWPGNLRELKRVIHAAVALSTGEILALDTVVLEPGEPAEPAKLADSAQASSEPLGLNGDLSLRSAELRHIRSVLEKMGGNKRRTARALGVSRSTLDRKLASVPSR